MTPDQWAALNLNAQITGVTIASPPVVNFQVTDANGAPVVGLEKITAKSATATVASYPNVSFALSKLVPGTNKSPDQWVSYIVTTVPTTTAAAAAQRPGTDNTGTLVGNGDGTYTYTFYRDITAIKQQVDGLTFSGNNRKEDLGDLTYAPDLQHRLVLQISGAARGTGTNTPTGADSGVAPANLENAVNAIYDFVPATGATIAKDAQAKYVVDISSCNACHDRLAFHGGGGRVDTQYCTTCHTSQRAYGRAKVVSTSLSFPTVTETATTNAVTGKTSYSYSPNLYIGDGEVMGHFTTMIHKIHNGHALQKSNYNYAGVPFERIGFSMLDNGQRMCTVCHNPDPNVAPKAELAYAKPSRQACGACHDGINWATGAGNTIDGGTGGHIGRGQQDDSLCDNCHQADVTRIDHRTVNLTTHNPAVTDGLANFKYLIDSVTVDNATGNAKIVFAIEQRMAPDNTNKLFATLPLPPNFTSGPSFMLMYALPQDGIAAPADYNNLGRTNGQPRTVSIASLIPTLVPAAKAGYYEATIPAAFPVGATMRAVGLQGYWSQTTAAGSIARHTISVVKSAAGDDPRRQVVDATKCASCHEWFEGHGGNRVIGVETGSNAELICMGCHNPELATTGRTIPDADMVSYAWSAEDLFKLSEWGVDRFATNAALKMPVTSNNMKDMIHGIHAGRDRVMPFRDARNALTRAITLLDFSRMGFPGTLSNCEGCHKAGTYSSVPTNALVSRHEAINATYAAAITAGTATPALAAASLTTQNATDAVITPFGAACVSCHDHPSAKGHMETNGARLSSIRSTATGSLEACQVCHGPGAEWDAAAVHK